MMALITPFLPYIVGALGLIGGLLGIAWGHKTTQTAKAQVDTAKAQAVAQVSVERTAEAQANQAAAQSGAAAVAARTEVDNTVATKPTDEVRNDLQNWTRS
jgi:xanthosine utilization system XapX-like protein